MDERRAERWHGGRSAVVVAGLAGVALWIQQLAATEAAFYVATMRALVGGLAVLGAVGIAHQVWQWISSTPRSGRISIVSTPE